MSWRNRRWVGLIGLVALLAGCDYTPKKTARIKSEDFGPLPSQPGRRPTKTVVEDPNSERPAEQDPEVARRREVILASVLKLMEQAYNNPGGRNFAMATENLNELFEVGTLPRDFAHTGDSKDFLTQKVYELTNQDPAPVIKTLESTKFIDRDARHIEDCMLYHSVATRVAGEGDDLTRVRRIFDWIVRNIQLVPPEALSAPGVRQAQARPADVLLRGMATESGSWSERGWLFMSLCRQIGVDVGILTYTPRRSLGMAPPGGKNAGLVSWVTAAIVDDKPYLFDARIGLEIPSLDGKSVATLEDVITHSEILDRLDLAGGQALLGTTAADLAGSPTGVGVLLDSSLGYLSPRMRLLQGQLRGEYRTILFRDPAEQARHFIKAMGPRFGNVYLWSLPIQVQNLLFTSPEFVSATQASLQFFDQKYPLLIARTKQLRGDLDTATNQYVALRLRTDAVTLDGKEEPISVDVQRALDIYSTYFLAQIQLDKGNTAKAEDLYRKMLELVPDPGPGRYFFYMLRWGALYNLGRIAEGRGDRATAIAYYAASDSTNGMTTSQHNGDLIRARRLVWNDPLTAPTAPLPAAPPMPAPAAPEAPPKIAAPVGR